MTSVDSNTRINPPADHSRAALVTCPRDREGFFISLTQGLFAMVDEGDLKWLSRWKWQAYRNRSYWRAATKIHGTTVHMPRLIMNAPHGMAVDHRNHHTLDNRRCNLRLCSRSENARNQRIRIGGTSQFKGVYFASNKQYRKPWVANIRYDGTTFNLGHFLTEREAAKAYDTKAREIFGEFAYLNFPHESIS